MRRACQAGWPPGRHAGGALGCKRSGGLGRSMCGGGQRMGRLECSPHCGAIAASSAHLLAYHPAHAKPANLGA